jgi:hypothetical protein
MGTAELHFKESLTRDFLLQAVLVISLHRAPEYLIKAISNFYEN